MGVKTIFKTILGTITFMVLSMLILELFNVSVVSYQLRQISRMAAKQSCELFTQETYKGAKTGSKVIGGAAGLEPILNCDGGEYISGNFYGYNVVTGTTMENVWKDIYKTDKFRTFCTQLANYTTPNFNGFYAAKCFLRVNDVLKAGGTTISVPTINWTSSNAEITEYMYASTASTYLKNMYTPANVGIPYLDDEILNKMYKWNLAQLLSNCNPDSIQKDDEGNYCVNFNGFRVYVDDYRTNISVTRYRFYDIEYNQSDILKDLNLTASSLHGTPTTLVNGDLARDNLMIVGAEIDYNLYLTYEGITPLKNLIAYVFNMQVQGLEATAPSYGGAGTYIRSGRSMAQQQSAGAFVSEYDMQSGTHKGVATSGELIYILDR